MPGVVYSHQSERCFACTQYVFMDMATYEETRVPKDDDWAKYMKEGMEVSLSLSGRVTANT